MRGEEGHEKVETKYTIFKELGRGERHVKRMSEGRVLLILLRVLRKDEYNLLWCSYKLMYLFICNQETSVTAMSQSQE